jgi:TRAP-type C4-dicarboxylate transport system permease small subunit
MTEIEGVVEADRISDSGSSFDSLISSITTEIIDPLVLLLSTAAVIYFLWGVYDFVKDAGNSGKRETGIKHMMWGIFGLVLTVSVSAVISIIENTLDF